MVEPSPSQLATVKPDFSATVELTRPERGTLEESAERAPGAKTRLPGAAFRTLRSLPVRRLRCRSSQPGPRHRIPHVLPTAAQVAGAQPAYP